MPLRLSELNCEVLETCRLRPRTVAGSGAPMLRAAARQLGQRGLLCPSSRGLATAPEPVAAPTVRWGRVTHLRQRSAAASWPPLCV